MPQHRRDWTNRKNSAVGFLVTALALAPATLVPSTYQMTFTFVTAGLCLAGLTILAVDWRIARRKKTVGRYSHPGALSPLDGDLYHWLVVVQAIVEQIKTEFGDDPTAKPSLNKIIASYNTAQAAYKIYHQILEAGGIPDTAIVQACMVALADLKTVFPSARGGK